MLSDNLKALHAHLAEYRHTGAEISAEGIAGICAVIEQASADALDLERSAVSGFVKGTGSSPFSAREAARMGSSACGLQVILGGKL